jgi:ribonucleoside-diphosphate reductase alpha chain
MQTTTLESIDALFKQMLAPAEYEVMTKKFLGGCTAAEMTGDELANLAAETAMSLTTKNFAFNTLAGHLVISNLHANITHPFSRAMALLDRQGLLDKAFYGFVRQHGAELDSFVVAARDFAIDYFGFKTLEKSYLQRSPEWPRQIVETPQFMFLRVATAIHLGDLASIRQMYDDLSQKYYIHGSPTLFNAGMHKQQLSSCYLVAMKEDSIEGIYDTIKECALISKWAGGVGIHIHNIRGEGSSIRGNNGTSDGIVPMLKVLNDTARYCNQAGKRPGSIAVYLEPWHSDVEAFLDLKKNHGSEDERARDLFYALWIPDLFMRRVEADGDWFLMCPDECPGLADVHSAAFDHLYETYVAAGRFRKHMKARTLWTKILHSQIENGVPYMLYKDACNAKSNQQNLGTIKSSNLCTEIIEYSSAEETAVCNLASLGLPMYLTTSKTFDHALLGSKVRQLVRNLNRVIDINYYPTECARRSNLRHRPIGLGVQGLADVLMDLNLSWESPEAQVLNRDIFETIYYYALLESCDLASGPYGAPYDSYPGSPLSQGRLQFDLWDGETTTHSGRYDWAALKTQIAQHGVRNSLLVAPMPTASTSQILGFTECIEPITSNIYTRMTLAGSFVVVNRRLMQDCAALGVWTEELKDAIIRNDGSVQGLPALPLALQEKYKTVWEIKQKVLIDMSAARGRYICQSQSLNLYMSVIDVNRLGSMHLYAWKQGLKTGLYYLRIRPVAKTQQFTLAPTPVVVAKVEGGGGGGEEEKEGAAAALYCTREAGCITCSS